jgi:hypothetical protein
MTNLFLKQTRSSLPVLVKSWVSLELTKHTQVNYESSKIELKGQLKKALFNLSKVA